MSVNAFVYPRAERNLGVTDKLKSCIVGNNQCYSSANTIVSAHEPNHVKFPSKNQSQLFGKHMAANMNSLTKSCQKTWPAGSVAGIDTKKPYILSKNRFHVLQHLDAIDTVVEDTNTRNSMPNMHGCMNQPRFAMQVKNKLVEKKTKMGF